MINDSVFNPELWQPAEYNRIYYPSVGIGLENEALVASQVEIWRKISRLHPIAPLGSNAPDEFDLVLLGGGGTLWDLPAAAPHVRNICYTDPFEKSREMIRQFINSSDNYWDSYIAHTLRQEGAKDVSEMMIRERARLIRERIVCLEECDVYKCPPVAGISGGAPIVAANFVMDSITNSKDIWYKLVRNVGELVQDGGCLIMSSLGKAHRWRSSIICTAPKQPATYLMIEDVRSVIEAIGFDVFYLQWIAAEESNREDYCGLIVCASQKRIG